MDAFFKRINNAVIGFLVVGCFAVGQLAVRTVRRRESYMQNTVQTIAKYVVHANLFRLGSSILRQTRSRGAAPLEDMGGKTQHKKNVSKLDKIL